MPKHKKSSFFHSPSLLYAILIVSLILNGVFVIRLWSQNIVTSVPDGDSLQLADGRRVRLLGIDAPERDQCMAGEAREKLRSLVMSKIVKLEDTVTDDYGRILANVIVEDFPTWLGHLRKQFYWSDWLIGRIGRINPVDPLLNHTLVSAGLAKYIYVRSPYSQVLKDAMESAKSNKLGIWSETCRRTSPINDCIIKGNTRDGEKVYHLPDCDNYDQVIIDQSYGDSWFCNEKEAISAGFRKASGCP